MLDDDICIKGVLKILQECYLLPHYKTHRFALVFLLYNSMIYNLVYFNFEPLTYIDILCFKKLSPK